MSRPASPDARKHALTDSEFSSAIARDALFGFVVVLLIALAHLA